jgi:pyruvate/2-oxoglutarate dehydrogenase complex dihydrolipoamide dehydrogenase (E3) component
LGQALARLGARVTLIQRGVRLLEKEEPAAAECVGEALNRDGVDVRLQTEVTSARCNAAGKQLELRAGDQSSTVEVDEILVATGRAPNVSELNLEAVGVESDPERGVKVNDRLQTTHPRIYAAGDVCGLDQLTHAADFQARIVVQNALFWGRARVSRLIVPRCTYTSPEVAHVGLTQAQAEAQGLSMVSFRQSLAENDRAVLAGETDGFVQVLLQRGTDRLLGATLVGEHAGEMLGELTLALQHRIGLGQLGRVIHPYPTVAEAIRKLGDQYQRTRLTPFIRTALQTWLKWT